MELYKEILAQILINQDVQVTFPGMNLNVAELIEMRSYQALKKIQAVIRDDSLEDDTCFMKIEEMIRIFEEIGSDGGNRHDFG